MIECHSRYSNGTRVRECLGNASRAFSAHHVHEAEPEHDVKRTPRNQHGSRQEQSNKESQHAA
jgi:hypothetical protein